MAKKTVPKTNHKEETPISPRERIVQTAMGLFNREGVHATGIDTIIAESGVAKKTFYNHFESKNKLIAEYFRRKDEIWFARLEKYAHAAEKPPLERLLGLFDGLKEWFGEPDFYGCPFIRGLSDFGKTENDPELVSCVEKHFERTSDLVESLLKLFRPKDCKVLVPQIMSLIAGATVVAHGTRNPQVATLNKEIARTLLAAM